MAHEHPIGDLASRQRYIARSGWLAIPGTVVAAAIGYVSLPPPVGVDTSGARVVLALRWLPVAILPYAAICLHIMRARFHEGSHDPLDGSESERLRIHCRAMQNTLEQLVWFGVSLLAVAAQLDPPQMKSAGRAYDHDDQHPAARDRTGVDRVGALKRAHEKGALRAG